MCCGGSGKWLVREEPTLVNVYFPAWMMSCYLLVLVEGGGSGGGQQDPCLRSPAEATFADLNVAGVLQRRPVLGQQRIADLDGVSELAEIHPVRCSRGQRLWIAEPAHG